MRGKNRKKKKKKKRVAIKPQKSFTYKYNLILKHANFKR